MSKTETETLVETLELSRDLTKYYLKNLEHQDIYKVFEIEGKQLNSIIWLIAHITVSENWLLLVCTGGEKVSIPWARQFGLGSEIPKKEDCPPFEEVLSYFKQVHEEAIAYVSQLSDDDLGKPTTNGIDFGGGDSVRAIIKHAIRHEGTHAGHLGWLCKLFGVKTI
ncbi:MAG: DinB family protein [Flavobacteriales bacterium]|nr:DinB family protein [Flavobacteriales bacterium]